MDEGARGAPAVRRFGDGSGAPALLLHCSLAHSGAWSGVAQRLAGALDMTAMDLPGHGRSPDWDRARDFHDQATAMARSVLPSGSHVVGHSFGAVVALRLALEGASIRSLTLIEPVLFAAAKQAGDPAHREHHRAFERIDAVFQDGDREGAARMFSDLWGSGAAWEAMPPELRAYQVERIHLIWAGTPVLEDDAAGLLVPGRLEALGVPTLLIQGGRSPAVIGATLGALAARLPDARRVTVPEAAHMVPITHPGDVADAIRAHVGAARQP